MRKQDKKKLSDSYGKVSERVTNADQHYDYLLSLVRENFGKGKRILDAGCGNGYLIKKVAKFCEENLIDSSMFAFDASRKMVDSITESYPNIQVNQEFLPETSYDDCSFDIILFSEVLEHLHAPRESLKELFRISKPDGKLIISVPNGDRIWIQEVIGRKERWQPADDVFYTYSELNMLLREAGWRLIHVSSIGWLFPRMTGQSFLKRLSFRVAESVFSVIKVFGLRKKTMVMVATKDEYLFSGKMN